MDATSMTVRSRCWLHAFALSAALLGVGCTGANAPAGNLGADIDAVAQTLIEQPLLHSASIAVVYRGQSFIRHRGDMVAGKAGPPTDATLYEIGSLSKTLAGTLVANAVLEGRLGLDDDVRSYLPGNYPTIPSTQATARRISSGICTPCRFHGCPARSTRTPALDRS